MSAHRVLYDMFRAPYEMTAPASAAAITIDHNFSVFPLTLGAGAETNTLAAPTKAGLVVTLVVQTAGGGTRTLTTATA